MPVGAGLGECPGCGREIDPEVTRFSKVVARDRSALVQAGRDQAREALPALKEVLEASEGSAVIRWMKEVRDRLAGALD